MKKLLSAVACAAAMALPAVTAAAPFAIRYTGTVNAGSTFAEFPAGSAYRVVLVFNNGGSSAANQTWTAANLTCIYYSSASGRQAYAQNLALNPPGTGTGSATTNAAGALTANFTAVNSLDPAPDAVGFTPAPFASWFNNNANDVFSDLTRSFGDAAGGVQMAPANWTNPQPWSVPCTAAAFSALALTPPHIPTLSQWGMLILSGLLVLAAFFSLRRSKLR